MSSEFSQGDFRAQAEAATFAASDAGRLFREEVFHGLEQGDMITERNSVARDAFQAWRDSAGPDTEQFIDQKAGYLRDFEPYADQVEEIKEGITSGRYSGRFRTYKGHPGYLDEGRVARVFLINNAETGEDDMVARILPDIATKDLSPDEVGASGADQYTTNLARIADLPDTEKLVGSSYRTPSTVSELALGDCMGESLDAGLLDDMEAPQLEQLVATLSALEERGFAATNPRDVFYDVLDRRFTVIDPTPYKDHRPGIQPYDAIEDWKDFFAQHAHADQRDLPELRARYQALSRFREVCDAHFGDDNEQWRSLRPKYQEALTELRRETKDISPRRPR
ncbi:MAG TPA: hypothetical protein VHT70_02910 [Candidatus Saccharimonadales bacterium]|nr:hypothetical protein [Candidatus Saccharimonadales bacterium]